MATTEKTDRPLNPWAKAGMSLAVLGLGSALALDLAYPDVEKTVSLKFPETLPGLSGTVRQKSDPHLGIKGIHNLELTIKGKAGDSYRVQIRGDRPSSSSDAPSFNFDGSRPIYNDSGPLTFSAGQEKSLSYSLAKIPGTAELEVFFSSNSGENRHFRTAVSELAGL